MSHDPQVCPAGRIPTCMLVDTLWGIQQVTYLSIVRERSSGETVCTAEIKIGSESFSSGPKLTEESALLAVTSMIKPKGNKHDQQFSEVP